jgi:hypothetical protein
MGIEALKQELRALTADEQRQMAAFLVSLENARAEVYRRKVAEQKIGGPASDVALLEDLDRRLGLSDR